MLYHNYHTHTPRCRHAFGDEREFIETAIASGFKTLGFSDHAPYPFPDSDFYSAHRMRPDELFAYAEKIRALAKEYEKDIRVLCGFELEYYPKYHAQEMAFLKQIQPDYCIMGQHFTRNEIDGYYVYGNADYDLEDYVTQTLEGLATGDFLYLAHPDLAGASFPAEIAKRAHRRLCEGAKKLGIPLEINLYGIRDHRTYPSKAFFEIAAEVGNDIVIGTDSHTTNSLSDLSSLEIAEKMVEELGLRLRTDPLL